MQCLRRMELLHTKAYSIVSYFLFAGEKLLSSKLSEVLRSSEVLSIQPDLQLRLLLFTKSRWGGSSEQHKAATLLRSGPIATGGTSPLDPKIFLLHLQSSQGADYPDSFPNQLPVLPAMDSIKGAPLAGVLEEIGYASTSSERAMRDVLRQYDPLSPSAVADVLIMMGRTHKDLDDPHGTQASLAAALSGGLADTSPPPTWNTDIFVDVVKAHSPGLNWFKVAEALDCETFFCPDPPAFKLLVDAFRRAGITPFPVQAFCAGPWKNAPGQLSLIRQAAAAPPEVFSFEHAPKRAAPVEGLHGGKSPLGTPNQAWLCLDLLQTLYHLAEQSEAMKAAVRQILEQPLLTCPEVRLSGRC